MRIEPTVTGGLAGGVQSAALATVRDATLAAIEVLVSDITESGATLRSDEALPKGTLVSLGLGGAGRVLASIARVAQGRMTAEFSVPLDARQMRRVAAAGSFATVAIPQRPAERAQVSVSTQAAAVLPEAAPSIAMPDIRPEAALIYGAGGAVRATAPDIVEELRVADARERLPFGIAAPPRDGLRPPATGLWWLAALMLVATLVYLIA